MFYLEKDQLAQLIDEDSSIFVFCLEEMLMIAMIYTQMIAEKPRHVMPPNLVQSIAQLSSEAHLSSSGKR